MGTSFTDPSNLGSVDSGDPCDFSSVAYDPVACANASGGTPGDTGLSVDTGDPCDPQSYAYDPAACAGSGTSGYDGGVSAGVISWCDQNPGMCDANGPTALGVSSFCAQFPNQCNENSDGTISYSGPVATVTPNGSIPGNPGTSFKGPGIPSIGGGGSGLGGLLSGLFNGINNIFSTCPAGYFKNSNGQCVKSGTATVPHSAGLFGGVNVGTLLVVGVVLLVLVKARKG